eukprot:TRINITY_DN4784_c0_g1_i2.p1 TRINITY_DN4784_c0_g1~~TRINITY_DN4784_c0_g1_i2.p1  ORF type:complete len:118 (+),score=10.30 TRINITY_DN4784_c0_g1_i2:91-444(+)
MDDESGNKLIVDEETRNELEWANDVENELIAHIIDCIEYTLKVAGPRFIAFFEEKGFKQKATKLMLQKESKYISNADRLNLLCIFIDIIELGGKSAADRYLNWFYPYLVLNLLLYNE